MNKPKFNPNKPFEAAEASKPKFDPNKPFDANEPSQLESSLRGAAQGASFGFADEATAAAESLFSDKSYEQARNESRAAYDAAQEANPKTFMAGNIGGSLATSFLPGLGVLNAAKGATTAGRVGIAAAQGGLSALGSSRADNALEMAVDTAIGGATGAAFQGIGEKVIGPLVSKAGGALKSSAEKLAEKATGATGTQAAKFQDGAGRELLNRGLVKFGDTPANIAQRAGAAKDAAGNVISSKLQQLDSMGVEASVDDIVGALQAKVAELKKVDGNQATIKQIENAIDGMYERGVSSTPISLAEEAKRNFQGQVNYFSPEFEKKGATSVADAYRREVEKKATQASPEMAKAFTDAKKTYGLLSPIQEAAEKRAMQQGFSPMGGLSDMAAAATGGAIGGPIGAAVGLGVKHVVAPRVASMAAVTTDMVSKALLKNPQAFGKWSGALSGAAARGQDAFNVTHHLLQQTYEGYRTMMRKMGEGGQ